MTQALLATLSGGFTLLPVLTTAVLRRIGARRQAIVTIIVCLALIPVMTGLTQRACICTGVDCAGYQSFLNSHHGLIQRLIAAVVFVPIAVVAYLLWRRSPATSRARSDPRGRGGGPPVPTPVGYHSWLVAQCLVIRMGTPPTPSD